MTQKNNLTKKDFTYIYQVVLRDKTLNAFDRGMLITLVNLADSWEISVEGLSRILPDGKTAISSSLKRLTDKGYVRLSHARDSPCFSSIKIPYFSSVPIAYISISSRISTADSTILGQISLKSPFSRA